MDALDYVWVHPTRGELFVSGNLTRLARVDPRVFLWLRLVPGVGLVGEPAFQTLEVTRLHVHADSSLQYSMYLYNSNSQLFCPMRTVPLHCHS